MSKQSFSDRDRQDLTILIEDCVNGVAAPEEWARLDRLLIENEEARDFYVRYMHTVCGLRTWGESPLNELESADHAAKPAPAVPASPPPRSPILGFLNSFVGGMSMANALMWMVVAVVCSGVVLTIFFCIVLILQGAGRSVVPARGGAEVAQDSASAPAEPSGEGNAPALHANPSADAVQPSGTVARLIHSYDCRWAIGSHSPHLGDDLEPGRKLVLLSGLAEVMFQSGARTLLEGPATMEIGSRFTARLYMGKLTVQVENPDAIGFQVYAAGMKYTDLGTEFGVWITKDGKQEMHVFRGAVKAEVDRSKESPASPHPIPAAAPIVLTADQAIRVVSGKSAMERVECHTKEFVHAAQAPTPFPLFGTGAGLDRGAADRQWEIVQVSSEEHFRPQPAVVAEPLPSYIPDSREAGQWIGRSRVLEEMPNACRMTFRTHFDLSGFDASSARIEGQITADDFIAEIRLNGQKIAVPRGARDELLFEKWLPLIIEAGFVEGRNTLEIVVENAVYGPHKGTNAMALCFGGKGMARRQPTLRATE
jgi:hypothetical protein